MTLSTISLRDPVYVINLFTIPQIPPCAKPHSLEETLIEPHHKQQSPRHEFIIQHAEVQTKRGSLGEIREHVQKRQSQLDEDWIPALAETFEAKLHLFPNIEITCCVCLGLGSLSEAIFRYIPRDDPIQKLRVLMILLELLGKQHSVKEVFFQEPDFNNADLVLLRSYGYSVVKTPFALTNSNTFVFTPCLDYNINARIFENGYQALHIGNLFEEVISKMRYEEFSGRDRSPVLLDEVMDRWVDATLAERMPMLKEGKGCATSRLGGSEG